MSDDVEDPGFKVTIKDVYIAVGKLGDKVDAKFTKTEERLSSHAAQIAAQWVVISIVIVALGATLVRALTA